MSRTKALCATILDIGERRYRVTIRNVAALGDYCAIASTRPRKRITLMADTVVIEDIGQAGK